MDYKKLTESACIALNEFAKQDVTSIDTVTYKSIIEQLKFISYEANSGRNPLLSLPKGKSFTYGIISSRNFASPEELLLKQLLGEVTSLLYPEDFS